PEPQAGRSGLSLAQKVRVVLVRTQHPGNIGSAARAMKNMGLRELVLVAPRKFPHPQATALAAGAVDVLDNARVCSTLPEALEGCVQVAGTTARSRYLSQPVFSPREWTERHVTRAEHGPIGLMFGCERTGLINDELDEARELISIPVDAAYPSLNLAQAVQVMCYEIRQVRPAGPSDSPAQEPMREGVPQQEMERFFEHLERALTATAFLDPDKPRRTMRRLRLLFGRLEPDANEMSILRGILTSVEVAARGGRDRNRR
ncbi:MAG: RNA methyltransferase, partial [Salinisphaera sp.]|nr:RNA methyltransferase [Salinisphaera sp.]